MISPLIQPNELRDLYQGSSARIQQEFAERHDGRAAIAQRAELVDSLALRLWNAIICEKGEPAGFALVALGGYGRRMLFPHSDIDLLFLHATSAGELDQRDSVRRFSQELWDLRLRLSPATRTVAECDRFDPNNTEFTISLLDCRFLAGDRELFYRLREKLLPNLVQREYTDLVENLTEVTNARHRKLGNTVFHLEPNLKDGPGGLRDYNVLHWLTLLAGMERLQRWPGENSILPAGQAATLQSAFDFLSAVRCFLHFRFGRDDNMLSWEAQSDAARQHIGVLRADPVDAAGWMRVYFQQARDIFRLTGQLMEELPRRSSLYKQVKNWRSRLSNDDFSVVDRRIFLQQSSGPQDSDTLLRLFVFQAHHGLKLSAATEQRVEQFMPNLVLRPPQGAAVWRQLREVLLGSHAAEALRSMHHLHVLTLLLPEFAKIDALVIRDYYHRFTVDEHTFVAIQGLHRLEGSDLPDWQQRFAELLFELERPELLFLALLLHDIGKGVPGVEHVGASVEIAERCLERLDLDPAERDTVLFLIASHLEVSAALRRDIFDQETIRQFSDKVGTAERLKMLALLTYADIQAVNPEALTPWKADNVWQLYIGTANYLNRSADQRLHVEFEDQQTARIRALAPSLGKKLRDFLEGLPERYLRTYSAKEIVQHVQMAEQLGKDPVQINLSMGRHWYELTLVTLDRPRLFSRISGVLAAWGMNIVKAHAFSDQAGVVVDTFYFTDPYRTLELNLPEWDRFQHSLSDVLRDEDSLDRLMKSRMRPLKPSAVKVKVETRVSFDDTASAHSTLLEVIAQDRPGLLHRITSLLAQQKCNIEIALIDTEGQMAIDVFYLTSAGGGLPHSLQENLLQKLRSSLLSD